jgi:predicted acyl esterase
MQELYTAMINDTRPDILRYTSPPLDRAATILGNVTAFLVVSSNASDTDFVAKLIDVFPNGTAMLVQQGALRMRWRNGPFATQPAAPMQVP